MEVKEFVQIFMNCPTIWTDQRVVKVALVDRVVFKSCFVEFHSVKVLWSHAHWVCVELCVCGQESQKHTVTLGFLASTCVSSSQHCLSFIVSTVVFVF